MEGCGMPTRLLCQQGSAWTLSVDTMIYFRQVIGEFGLKAQVHFIQKGQVVTISGAALLPYAFDTLGEGL